MKANIFFAVSKARAAWLLFFFSEFRAIAPKYSPADLAAFFKS